MKRIRGRLIERTDRELELLDCITGFSTQPCETVTKVGVT